MSNIWLVGSGGMARDYANVLTAIGLPYEVVGRGGDSATRFEKETGTAVIRGGVEKYLASGTRPPDHAIICVGVESLAEIAMKLLSAGIKNILVEKPAGCSPLEIKEVYDLSISSRASVSVGYNRRFYASVINARRIIAADGGVTSFSFEFTEWSHIISKLEKAPRVKQYWFLGNSSHVVDMAFFLGGWPRDISCFLSGGLDWHPTASIFAGAGVSETGAVFSYQANWGAPGRWSVEILTKARRLVFRPLEKLQMQNIGSLALDYVDIDDALDREYKPGLFLQTKSFLEGKTENLCSLGEHYSRLPAYCQIAGYPIPNRTQAALC